MIIQHHAVTEFDVNVKELTANAGDIWHKRPTICIRGHHATVEMSGYI